MGADTYSYRHRLAHELIVLRQNAGLSRKQVCERVGWSGAKMSRVEAGTRIPIVADVLLLAHIYGAGEKLTDELLFMVGQGRMTPSCAPFADILSEAKMEYFERLLNGQRIQEFYGGLLPHLLRTETYSASLRENEIPELNLPRYSTFDETVRQWRTRIDQSYLIHESALWRVVGGPSAWREQLLHLVSQDRKSGIEIRVIPFSAGPIGATNFPFAVLDVHADTRVGVIHVPYHDPVFKREAEEIDQMLARLSWLNTYAVPLDAVMSQALARLA